MSPKFLLVLHSEFPHSYRLGESDAIRKFILEVFDFWQAVPLQKWLQCIDKPGTTFNGNMDSTLVAGLCDAWSNNK